jgi:hypothetical protein
VRGRQLKGVNISFAGGWIEVASIVHPPGDAVVSMRPVSVFAKGPGSEIEQLRGGLHGRWRQAARAVMVLLAGRLLPLRRRSASPATLCQICTDKHDRGHKPGPTTRAYLTSERSMVLAGLTRWDTGVSPVLTVGPRSGRGLAEPGLGKTCEGWMSKPAPQVSFG